MPELPLPPEGSENSLRNQSLPPSVTPQMAAEVVQAAAPQVNYQYAGFWIRYAAIWLDGIIIGLPIHFAAAFLVGSLQIPSQRIPGSIFSTYDALVWLLTILITIFFIMQYGATPGKMFFGLKITKEGNEKIDFGTAIIREIIGKILDVITILLGFVLIAFDSKKQGLHDKIAKTYVIYNEPLSGLKKFLAAVIIFLPLLLMLVTFLFMGALLGSFLSGFRATYNGGSINEPANYKQNNFGYQSSSSAFPKSATPPAGYKIPPTDYGTTR